MSQPPTAHSLSLKVLRLSRPSLATQTPLPNTAPSTTTPSIPPTATLAYPSASPSDTNPLTPLLTLPASFGAAYVGETFSCTLCVNNDIPPVPSSSTGTQPNKTISAVRIAAELQTPSTSNSAGIPLDLSSSPATAGSEEEESSPPPGSTLQRTLSHDLKEAGPHVLAVTVSYTETLRGGEGEGASGGRARTFRKLYQFVAQPVIAVRSKVSPLAAAAAAVIGGEGGGRRWVLEAQLENVGEGSVVVERVWLVGGEGVGWKGGVEGDGEGGRFVVKPRDVQQVMFVLEEEVGPSKVGGGGRPLAQVEIDWRSAMGEKGRLTTGWLAARA
ncbi:hypothetical protein Q7P37_008772 [Cladosporium fusiforme]